jgi:hypothetical protein
MDPRRRGSGRDLGQGQVGRRRVSEERRRVTVPEIIATFSEHLSKSYPPPKEFRRNFDLLLGGKRGRGAGDGYALSLEKNIVFLSCLLEEVEALLTRLLGPSGSAKDMERIPAALEAMEKRSHERTVRRHREGFIEGTAKDFEELRRERPAGGADYLAKLEFNYRYLMTLRIFMTEFISVLAAIRAEYSIAGDVPENARAIRSQLELVSHYYLGNVAVGERDAAKSGGR